MKGIIGHLMAAVAISVAICLPINWLLFVWGLGRPWPVVVISVAGGAVGGVVFGHWQLSERHRRL